MILREVVKRGKGVLGVCGGGWVINIWCFWGKVCRVFGEEFVSIKIYLYVFVYIFGFLIDSF